MKEELAQLKHLEEDCQSILRSLGIIQSAQRILTYYTADERRLLFKEYTALNSRRRSICDLNADPNSELAVFRQDHPDLALIADVLAQGELFDLKNLKLKLQGTAD